MASVLTHAASASQIDDLKARMEREKTEVDLFVEQCSSLYNLILDALHDLSNTEDALQCGMLEEMASSVERAGARLTHAQPDTEGTVQLRMHTINSAMEQLRLRKGNCGGDADSQASRGSISLEIRNWLQSVERRLAEHEQRLRQTAQLTKLLADQQVLQLEIQSEGQACISRLEQQLHRADHTDCALSDRRRLFFESTRKRWHAVYLNSLSLQIRIEERIARFSESCESDSDPDTAAPPYKRARRSSALELDSEEEEDTFPFAASEYESIMDGRLTATSESASDAERLTDTRGNTKWGSAQQDIGYSSGENSIHEALNKAHIERDEMGPRRRIDCSPVKNFYRTVPLDTDVSDCELLRIGVDGELVQEEKNLLSDSMIVNYESLNGTINGNEYDEVLRLMDDDGMTDSFHTQWREIRAQPRRRRLSREILEQIGKASCDASSEESSDMDAGCEAVAPSIDGAMDRSFMSNATDFSPQFGSLKRGRSQRGLRNNSSLLLDCSEMDASFCSTRSELVPGRQNRALRKRLKVRRLPRSMSDGEQLGVGATVGTPSVRVSPPRTPLARSTRLLQRLDQALRCQESDTAPEQSDVAAYEWDDYKPPNKDESCDGFPMAAKTADDLLSVDEDYNRHFGGAHHTLARLIKESRANLLIVAKGLEGVDDPQVLRDVELIARTNIRQLDTAVKMNGAGHINDVRELESIRCEWSDLLDRVQSPVPQILAKFEKFTATLRSLDQTPSVHCLNGVSQICSREDAAKVLSSMLLIQDNLSNDRDELRSLLSSVAFRSVMGDNCHEFDAISGDFDEAVVKIGGLVASLRQLNADWLSWSTEQQRIRDAMNGIEDALRSGTVDHPHVLREIELCQERMNSLETMCNYLTSSLVALQDDEREEEMAKVRPDFGAEIRLYANALEQLKSRFTELTRVPTPPRPASPELRKRDAPSIASFSSAAASASATASVSTQSDAPPTTVSPPRRRSTRAQLAFLFGGLVLAIAALFFTYVYGATFGPHLTYVSGPPPV